LPTATKPIGIAPERVGRTQVDESVHRREIGGRPPSVGSTDYAGARSTRRYRLPTPDRRVVAGMPMIRRYGLRGEGDLHWCPLCLLRRPSHLRR